ncbi:MAG: alpha/beta hydrolase, partial [Bacteroidota bacterium]|nr:alpha/beta hydrolase [Bacteroidota bacterium]
RKYLSYRDPFYLEWALDAFFNWKQKKPLNYVIHIHGTYDMVFPIIYLKEFIPLKGGTHAMIIFKKKWFNENLPKIILDD